MNVPEHVRPILRDLDVHALLDHETDDARVEAPAWNRFGDTLDGVLYRVLGVDPRGCADPAPRAAARAPSRAASAILRRVRARDLRERALRFGDATIRAFHTIETRDGDEGPGTRTRELSETLIALALAVGNADCLCERLAHVPLYTVEGPPVLAKELTAELATVLAESAHVLEALQARLRSGAMLANGDLDIARTRALDGATDAAALAARLEQEVRSEPVDAAGADLSALDIPDTCVLAGVAWDDATRWPAALAAGIRGQSDRVAPGAHRVRHG